MGPSPADARRGPAAARARKDRWQGARGAGSTGLRRRSGTRGGHGPAGWPERACQGRCSARPTRYARPGRSLLCGVPPARSRTESSAHAPTRASGTGRDHALARRRAPSCTASGRVACIATARQKAVSVFSAASGGTGCALRVCGPHGLAAPGRSPDAGAASG